MSQISPKSLVLSELQNNALRALGIDVSISDSIYLIDGELIHRSLSAMSAYATGYYIFFIEQEQEHEVAFLRYIFGLNFKPEIVQYHQGVRVYNTPLTQFVQPEAKVNVSINILPSDLL